MTERERRTKAELDPELLGKVLAVVAVGAGRKAAAQQAGISEDTLRSYERIGAAAWERREKALLEDEEIELSSREALFADFFEKLQRAESNNRVYLLDLVKRAAGTPGKDGAPATPGDWRAGAWLLERLYPADFGQKVDVNAKHSGELTQRVDLSKLSEEELFYLRKIQKKLTEEGKKP